MTDSKNEHDSANNEPDQLDTDWEAAMAEQLAGSQSSSQTGTQADGLSQGLDDDWAAALAEQTAASTSSHNEQENTTETTVTPAAFQPISGKVESPDSDGDIHMIMDIPVQLTVELGRTRLTIKNILQLGQGSVVELDGLAGEPLDIFVNGYLIAQGEVVVVDEKYGIRVTDIITPSDRIQRLNGRR
ncbi:MAG TPA: flagellar motor switch protein FliN [Paenalcaligenes sp.]|nr:flagellar motor switch protein FliN [Paenalcaligenes sp.]